MCILKTVCGFCIFFVMYYSITFVYDVNQFYALPLFFFVIVFVSQTHKCSCQHCKKVSRVTAKTSTITSMQIKKNTPQSSHLLQSFFSECFVICV